MNTRSNEEWLRALRGDGVERQEALKDLREGILRVILSYLASHGFGRVSLNGEGARQLAEDCSQEALLAILAKLETFRGESRFTTWAYAIAIRFVLGELRRRRWKDVSLDQSRVGEDLPAWPIEDSKSPDPERAIEQEQVWNILREIIEKELTQRQRFVLIAHVFQEMPLELAADRLGTNRDNVYKILHDARRKLKRCLSERDLTQEEILDTFEAKA